MLGREQAEKLTQDILQRCEPQPAEVLLFVGDRALTRFANNAIHQNVAESDVDVLVRVIAGENQLGTAVTNRLDPSALDEVVERAKTNAQSSPADPYFPGLAPPTGYESVVAFDEETVKYTPRERADTVGVICRLAAEQGLNASGAFSTKSGEVVIANSAGVFAYHPLTQADFQTVVIAEDASGRAQRSHWKVGSLDVEALGREAIRKAVEGCDPQPLEPGEYPVVLDPYATADVLQMLNFYGMGAQSVLEGRSWMSDRIGEQAMSPLVTIWDDGLDRRGIPMPFDFEGVPKQKVELVSQGVVQGPVYDRYTGGKMDKPSTGHALPPTARNLGPLATHLFMQPGEASTQELIQSTERGLYITRFWYTRVVHPRDCVVTGMTRDGVFWIENGRLEHPVKNLRFTQSYVQALADVEIIGSETRLLQNEFAPGGVFAPAVKIKAFHFTGMTV
jgi:predicted Zn-dependent protease